jgi:hypothetical protein
MSIPDTIKRALIKYLPFAPTIVLAVLIPAYWVDVPQYDEWDSVMLFEHLSQGSLTLGLLFKQVNEYRQFFPNVIFVGLGKLTHWDLRYEMILVFAAACLISLNVRRLAVLTIQASELQFAILLLMGNLVIFSLTQYENWFQAQQLVYYMPILCVTTSIVIARTNLGTLAKFAICAALSFVSTFSSANGIVCWVVVLPLLVFTEWPTNRRSVLWLSGLWMLAVCLCLALYLHGYEKPWWTPSPLTGLHHPFRAFIYFLGFVGGPLGLERVRLSIVAGAVMTAGLIAVCLYLVKHRRDRDLIARASGWLVIAAYSLATAVMTTIGRVGLTTGPSQVPRYLGFSVYLLLALVFLAHIIGTDLQHRSGRAPRLWPNPLAFITIVVLLLYQPFMWALSYRQMDAWQTRLLQAKASILLINQLPDTRLTKILYPNLQFLIEKANALDHLGLMRPSLVRTKHLNQLGFSAAGRGEMRPVERTTYGYAASGFATLDQKRPPDAIILAYDAGDNDPIAFAISYPLKRPASIFHGVAPAGAWLVRFTREQLPQSPVTITAWAFDATTGRAFRLSGESQINTARETKGAASRQYRSRTRQMAG